jgi:hypothetical protein
MHEKAALKPISKTPAQNTSPIAKRRKARNTRQHNQHTQQHEANSLHKLTKTIYNARESNTESEFQNTAQTQTSSKADNTKQRTYHKK